MSVLKTALSILALFLLKESAFGALSVSDIADRFSDAVVTVSSLDKEDRTLSWGSGFFIGKRGDIVTSYHLFAGAARASVTTRQGKKGDIVELIGNDPKADLVVARTTLTYPRPLNLGDSDRLQVGEKVVALGNSGGLTGGLSLGTIEGFFPVGGIRVIQLDAPLSEGGSGGPILDSKGEVVGVSTAFLKAGALLHFAMPVNRLKALKPMRLDIARLPGRTLCLEAVMRGSRLVELDFKDHRPSLHRGALEGLPKREPVLRPQAGTVYFRNGKRLVCERAWLMGETVFLVVKGKKFALGYDQNQIDMERSFILYL